MLGALPDVIKMPVNGYVIINSVLMCCQFNLGVFDDEKGLLYVIVQESIYVN
jgi:hypothetical protein